MSVCGNRWGTVVNVVRLVRKICHKWVNISCIEAARSKDRLGFDLSRDELNVRTLAKGAHP